MRAEFGHMDAPCALYTRENYKRTVRPRVQSGTWPQPQRPRCPSYGCPQRAPAVCSLRVRHGRFAAGRGGGVPGIGFAQEC